VQCLGAGLVLAVITGVGFFLQANQLTMGLLYLVVVGASASWFGFRQASIISLIAMLMLDYYFEPPVLSFAIASPEMFVALATFELAALAISRLHGRERRLARESSIQRNGLERLYELSRNTLMLDLRRPTGGQLAVLIHRIFAVTAVAIFDARLARQDKAGSWRADEEDLAKECYLSNVAEDDSQTQTARRILKVGDLAVGALVIRGELDSLVIDGLAALVAIAFNRYELIENEDKAEEARRAEHLRTGVMDALAHELKTPLTAIQTASSGLLELGGLPDLQTELVGLIDGEVARVNELCTKLLQTAKLNPRKVDLNVNDVNVREVIQSVLGRRPFVDEGDRFQIAVEDRSLNVEADRGLLEMILTQYLDNARKYSKPDTAIEIAVRKSRTEVLISVHNFGSVIRIEDRERVFDRFYRAPAMKDSVPGTGIGLSAAKKAAEAHHGHVWVISDEKNGTTFFLSIPNGGRRTS
jgi:two-component system sensor histidine kinase KdpD